LASAYGHIGGTLARTPAVNLPTGSRQSLQEELVEMMNLNISDIQLIEAGGINILITAPGRINDPWVLLGDLMSPGG
jgi:hypothetical protein